MLWIPVVLLVLLAVVVIGGYNGLVSLRQQTMSAWGQIDVQLKRRYDLIPNLVETVKGFMAHEQGTLEKVIQARSAAMGAQGVREKATAEGQLSNALTGFFALAESYPQLKSDTVMVQLQEELRSTENQIALSRQYYNDVVTAYNTKIEAFPSNLIANMGSFKPRDLFELEEAAAREPVAVKF